ncbi:MAG TPA: UPF0149 family protein [Longimicrobiales bacterium]|nr:UPF0149 family protein [Longimicrobiales bacterium]
MSAVLESFLRKPGQPAGTLTPGELPGFLFAVASAPDLVPPSEWLPVIFDEGEPVFDSEEEAQAVMGAFMDLYNSVVHFVEEGADGLPPGCEFRDDLLANFGTEAPVSQWARGFVAGHMWLEEAWEDLIPEEWEDELAAVALTLTFFASREFALAYLEDSARTEADLPEAARIFREAFTDAVGVYAGMGMDLWEAVQEEEGETNGA